MPAKDMESNKHFTFLYQFGLGSVMMLKLALVGWWPLLARMHERTDSVLFIRRGIALLEGDWLGASYDYAILMKGPMMSFWIAATNYLGWPVNFAREALYLLTCLLALKALSLICRSKWALFLTFCFLVFVPAASAYGPLAALFRGSIHLSLVLAVQALLVILFVKYARGEKVHLHEAGLLGVFLLAFFLNREETPWIFPQLAWFALGTFGVAWWRFHQENTRINSLDLLKIMLIPVVIIWAGVESISNKNYEEYGIDAVLEIDRPEFKSAYKGLMRIKPDSPANSAALPPDVIQKLLSLPRGSELNVPPFSSGQRLTAMRVPWKFRSAVQKAGYYKQGGAAVLGFYESLGEELNTACEREKYACRPVLFGAIPIFDGLWSKAFTSLLPMVTEIVTLYGFTPSLERYPSYGDYNYRRNMSLLTSAPLAITARDREKLPKFYAKMERKKTSLLERIFNFYQKALPVLAILSSVIFVMSLARALHIKTVGVQEFILVGLFGALLTQLLVFSLLSASGLSTSIRLYFNTYPVLLLFIAMNLIHLGQWVSGSLRGESRE